MAKKDIIDFGEVPEEIRKGGSYYAPPGDYLVKIVGVEKQWKNNDHSNPAYYRWEFKIDSGEHKGTILTQNTTLAPKGLFNLRNLIHAVTGKNVAGRKLGFDPETLKGKKLAVTVEDREYTRDNKQRLASNVVDMRPEEEYEAAAEAEEVEEVDDDEVEVEEEALEEVDLDEL